MPMPCIALYPQMGFMLAHILVRTQIDPKIRFDGVCYTGSQILQMGAAMEEPELALSFWINLAKSKRQFWIIY